MGFAAMYSNPVFRTRAYLVSIVLIFIGIVFSKAILSLSMPFLFLVIISDKDGIKRLWAALKNKIVLILISVLILHVVSLAWSSDINYGLKDIKVKLPLLVFPILLAAFPKLDKHKIYLLLKSFIYLLAFFSAINIVRHFIYEHNSNYHVVLWHSHIRFSLMICLALFMSLWLFTNKALQKKERFVMIIAVIILFYFLILLESFTGYVILAALLPLTVLLYQKQIKTRILKIILALVLAGTLIYAIFTVYIVKSEFFPDKIIPEVAQLDSLTVNGNHYDHDPNTTLTENGVVLYHYLCFEELANEWNKRSEKKISKDSIISNANILVRYLSSKGLRKDSVGVWQLNAEDIVNIEMGIPNYRLPKLGPVRSRVYQFFWELSVYYDSGDPSGHSLTQRLEYWKTAMYIIENNFWTGVGSGDVSLAFINAYEELNSKLQAPYRLRAHNQFLTFWISFGLFGLLLFLFSIVYPFLFDKYRKDPLYIAFIFIFLLSMLNEDTLESQVGVTFYAFFNALLLFVVNKATSTKNKDMHT